MDYFIGIVPPDRYKGRIEQLQSRWVDKSGVEPHITLKAQGGLTHDLAWLERVREVCKRVKPFRVVMGDPAYFGESILYLSAQSVELMELHRRIVQAVSPSPELIKRYFELDDFFPHMTLGQERYGNEISSGMSKHDLREMERLAKISLTPYPAFEVTFIRVYVLNLMISRYEIHEEIELLG